MAKIIHLRNAPIAEAVVDYRVKARDALEMNDLTKLIDVLKGEYPTCEDLFQFSGEFKLDLKEGLSKESHEHAQNGFMLKSSDGSNVTQLTLGGFSFSRLHPYTSWHEVYREANRLWNLYKEVAAPDLITRLAVRYINKLELPSPKEDLLEYLTAPPKAPLNMPIVQHSLRTKLFNEETKVVAVVTQALEVLPGSKGIVIILDNDVYKAQQYRLDDPKLDATFGILHDMKNQLFFNAITQGIVERYK